MLTKQKVLHLVLALLKGGDLELLKNGSILHGESCSDYDKEKIRKIGQRIAEFYASYDYFLSPEFSKQIEGKSEIYRNKKMQMESIAPKKKKHKDAFMSAIRELQTTDKLYDLLPLSEYGKIKELMRWLDSLGLEKGI